MPAEPLKPACGPKSARAMRLVARASLRRLTAICTSGLCCKPCSTKALNTGSCQLCHQWPISTLPRAASAWLNCGGTSMRPSSGTVVFWQAAKVQAAIRLNDQALICLFMIDFFSDGSNY
jgi:hypothetical protein